MFETFAFSCSVLGILMNSLEILWKKSRIDSMCLKNGDSDMSKRLQISLYEFLFAQNLKQQNVNKWYYLVDYWKPEQYCAISTPLTIKRITSVCLRKLHCGLVLRPPYKIQSFQICKLKTLPFFSLTESFHETVK